jgi:hypothetical protein
MSTVHVTSDFRVVVRHDSTPIPGIPIEVYDDRELSRSEAGTEWKPLLRLITSREGTAEVKGLGKGRYVVEIGGPGGGSAVYAVVADQSGESSHEISLQWPNPYMGMLKASRLSGQLVSNNPWAPFQNVQVQLWTAGVETPLAVEETGPKGRFSFNETRPGIYVVRVLGRQDGENPSNQIRGDLPVELSPSAPDALASISLRLGMTTCGISYGSCPVSKETPIATASRRIKVIFGPDIGSESPYVENAKYKLLDERGALIVQGTIDHSGVAELPSDANGKATLVVAYSMLTTVEQSLELLPSDAGAPNLLVSLSRLGSDNQCSAVSLEKHATQK